MTQGFWKEFFLLKPDTTRLREILEDTDAEGLINVQVGDLNTLPDYFITNVDAASFPGPALERHGFRETPRVADDRECARRKYRPPISVPAE